MTAGTGDKNSRNNGENRSILTLTLPVLESIGRVKVHCHKDLQANMKCDKCEKPATFHITERVGDQWSDVHLCEDCAREYLAGASEPSSPSSLASALAQQFNLKLGQTAEELERLDQRACPICGVTFYEFRHQGRLGCPHDYVCFEEELEPLIVNIHGASEHKGKHPKRSTHGVDNQSKLIRLRREMRDAVQAEDYERASELRDEIKAIEDAD